LVFKYIHCVLHLNIPMNKRILFINNYTATSTVPELIAGAGYSVEVALDTEVACRGLQSRHYDLIILVENPYAASWLTCKNIRRLTTIPMIVISHGATTETCVKAINAGADYFMRKSFGTLELFARINSLLQRVPSNKSITLAY
jgi:DNA-binding response OmpR family regulator